MSDNNVAIIMCCQFICLYSEIRNGLYMNHKQDNNNHQCLQQSVVVVCYRMHFINRLCVVVSAITFVSVCLAMYVLRLTFSEDFTVTDIAEVYNNNGRQLSGASVAFNCPRYMLVGSAITKILLCQVHRA